MSLSLFVRNTVIGWGLALALPSLVLAQSTFAPPYGSEYPVGGSLPGDQTRPRLGLSPSGGYAVWEDNAMGTEGTGIRAVALDSLFGKVQAPFRVNQIAKGYQEWPQVALLNGGGAVFAWQGGALGQQNICARFLSPSNTWLSGDLLVNTFTGPGFRKHPSLAVLANGNVVIVYGSYNQQSAGSMQDVYGQILTPAGQKAGNEFLVNTFTPFNQRDPAVAPLTGGGFVVVWVSEQENNQVDSSPGDIPIQLQIPQGLPSVEIYARVYGASGQPVSNEIQVSTSLNNACSMPAVVGATDGGFVVAWAQKDLGTPSNGLDIYSRPFTNSIGGPVNRVNSFLTGDQYAPSVSALGSEYLVTWTSADQTGSSLGIFSRFLRSDGSPEGTNEFRVNTSNFFQQMHPTVASDGSGRFLAVWSSYAGGFNSFDVLGQVYASAGYVPAAPGPTPAYGAPAYDPFLTAPPAAPDATTGTTPPATNATPPEIVFPVLTVQGGVLSNALILAQGAYSGVFSDTNGASALSSGLFSAKVTRGGAYSAKLALGNRTYSLSGKFDNATGLDFNPATGLHTRTVSRGATLPALAIQLRLDLSTSEQILGSVSSGSAWSADLLAFRQVFDLKTNRASAFAGNYTLVIRGDPAATATPAGHGCGTIKVDAAGNLQWSGALADGTKVTQSTTISRQGYWPLFASLYGGNGLVMSWVQFANDPSCDLFGQTVWIKPAISTAKASTPAFTNEVVSVGAVYAPPAAGAGFTGWKHAELILSGGGLTGAWTNSFGLDSRSRMVNPGAKSFSLSLNSATGLFNGSALNPDLHKTISFQGVMFQTTNGFGYFLGPSQSGQVYMAPAQ